MLIYENIKNKELTARLVKDMKFIPLKNFH